jgi:hypothetical protein
MRNLDPETGMPGVRDAHAPAGESWHGTAVEAAMSEMQQAASGPAALVERLRRMSKAHYLAGQDATAMVMTEAADALTTASPAPAPMDALHRNVMNIPLGPCHRGFRSSQERSAYAIGHKEARHAAAELVVATSAAFPAPACASCAELQARLTAAQDEAQANWQSVKEWKRRALDAEGRIANATT